VWLDPLPEAGRYGRSVNARDMRVRWDEKYADAATGAETDRPPHQLVVDVVRHLAPGSALDLGAGDGRHAVWLAEAGWHVTAMDFSGVAIGRLGDTARRRLGERTHHVRALVGDITTDPPAGAFDLVLVSFVHLPHPDRIRLFARAAERVAAGGVLAVVGHHRHNIGRGTGGTQDPEVLCTEHEVAAYLADHRLSIERAEAVERPVDGVDVPAIDLVVVARRAG
jgi:SAM-dependent methyltransferase